MVLQSNVYVDVQKLYFGFPFSYVEKHFSQLKLCLFYFLVQNMNKKVNTFKKYLLMLFGIGASFLTKLQVWGAAEFVLVAEPAANW